MIALLDRFSDGTGREMSHAWLTKGERKARKEALLDDSLIALDLTAGIDARAAPVVRRAAKRGIALRTAPLESVATLSHHLRAIIARLQRASATDRELYALVQERAVSPLTAERSARATISLLLTYGRARRVGQSLELV